MKAFHILITTWALAHSAVLHAQSAPMIKLHAHSAKPQNNSQFGTAAAMNDKWIVIGEYGNKDSFLYSGAVHVFQASTGLHVRQILNPLPKAFALFGVSVAVSGDLALVGASGAGMNGEGAAFLFDLNKGSLLRTIAAPSGCQEFGCSVALSGRLAAIGDLDADLGAGEKGAVFIYPDVVTGPPGDVIVPGDAMAGDQWGISVAVSGRFLLAGAPKHNAEAGAAYLFDLMAGAQLRKFNGTGNDNFGKSVAMGGGKIVIGAPQGDTPMMDAGTARVYDMESGIFIRTLSAGDGATNSNFGHSVAATPDLILVGSPFHTVPNSGVTETGAAYLYNARSGLLMRKLQLPGRKQGDFTGFAVSLSGGNALVTSFLSDEVGANRGSASLYMAQNAELFCHVLAAQKNSAPDLPDTRHASFGERAIGPQGSVIFGGSLSGLGTAGGKTAAMFSSLSADEYADLAIVTGMDLTGLGMAGVKATAFSNPCMNSFSMGIFQAKLAGAGVTPLNNQLLLADNGMEIFPLLRTGASPAELGGGVVSSFKQVVQGQKNDLGPAVLFQLKVGPGSASTATDTGILVLNTTGGVQAYAREGNLSPPGDNFGQFHRAALDVDRVIFCADLVSSAATNQGIFSMNTTTGIKTLLLRKGDPAPDIANAVIASFIGETGDQNQAVLVRGTAAGSGVTAANKECLWRRSPGGMWSLIARAGTQVPGMGAGIQWAKFLQYWTIGGQQVLVLGQVKGTGVAPATDQVLWLAQEDGSHQVLLREGDLVSEYGHLRVNIIQQVTVHSTQGRYAVQASLLGAPKDQDQVLFTGRTFGTNMPLSSLRQPFVRMRKGMAYDYGQGVISKLTSATWSPTLSDTTGAGAKGLAQSLNFQGQMVLMLGFANGISEVALINP